MPPARSNFPSFERRRETAEGQGCLSGFILPPLIALVVGVSFLVFLSRLAPESKPTNIDASNSNYLITNKQGNNSISPIFTPEIQYWGQDILRWSSEYSLDPNLVATVMQIESCGNPDAQSSAGAMGLFQVMPFHFQPIDNPFDPDTNAQRGLAYLQRSLIAAGGDVNFALAGYNGGISIINLPQSEWPDETQRYLYWGSGIYADATSGSPESPHMGEWLSHASGMCGRARTRLNLP
jgi:Transglycosylase SLT domain